MELTPEEMAAISAAFGGEAQVDSATGAPSTQDPATTDETAAPAADGGDPETASPSADDEGATATDDGGAGDEGASAPDAVPTKFFELDLSDIDDAKRAEIIEHAKKKDAFVTRLQQRIAELERETQAPANEPPAPPSDEELLAALGLDKDDPYYEIKAGAALPLAKKLLEVEAKVTQTEQVNDERALAEWESHWNGTLDQLENEYGELPVSREDLLRYCLDEDIYDPVEAYSAATEDVRREAAALADAERREALRQLKLAAAQPPAPKTSPAATEPKDARITDVRDAVKLAEEQTGVRLSDIFTY